MDMRFTPVESIAPLAKVWRPKLLFTGVSIMQINPEVGLVSCVVHMVLVHAR